MDRRRVIITAGVAVFVCDLDEAGLSGLARELPGLHTWLCDVADRGAVERMGAANPISGQMLPIDNDSLKALQG
jgi:short-subunit dehydrogenase involved in D-alanine esterification of teichoic acids